MKHYNVLIPNIIKIIIFYKNKCFGMFQKIPEKKIWPKMSVRSLKDYVEVVQQYIDSTRLDERCCSKSKKGLNFHNDTAMETNPIFTLIAVEQNCMVNDRNLTRLRKVIEAIDVLIQNKDRIVKSVENISQQLKTVSDDDLKMELHQELKFRIDLLNRFGYYMQKLKRLQTARTAIEKSLKQLKFLRRVLILNIERLRRNNMPL